MNMHVSTSHHVMSFFLSTLKSDVYNIILFVGRRSNGLLWASGDNYSFRLAYLVSFEAICSWSKIKNWSLDFFCTVYLIMLAISLIWLFG